MMRMASMICSHEGGLKCINELGARVCLAAVKQTSNELECQGLCVFRTSAPQVSSTVVLLII